MQKRFLEAGLHIRFLKWVLLPSLGASLLWWIADSLPHPANRDLLLHSPAALLAFIASVGGILWLAKTVATALAVKQPPQSVDDIVSHLVLASLEKQETQTSTEVVQPSDRV